MSDMAGAGEAAPAAAPDSGGGGGSVITSDAVGSGPEDGEETRESSSSSDGGDKPAKPKGRKRKVKRGKEEVDVDLDDEESILKLISDPAKYRVKVDREDRDVTLDDLIKDYELREASYIRMQNASEITNEHKQRLEALKADPSGKLIEYLEEQLEVDPIELLWKLHEDEVRLQELATEGHPNYNPQQYAQAVAERARGQERKRIEREQARAKAQEARQAEQEKSRTFYESLANELKASGMAQNEVTVGTLRQMVNRLGQSGEPVDPKTVVYEAGRKVRETLASMLPSDPEQLAEFLGDERIKALNKLAVQRARKAEQKPPKSESNGSQPKGKARDWASVQRSFRNGKF